MRVIYYTCYADPWIKVAQKLKDEKGLEPIYWVGYEDDNSKKLVSENFPTCIYQDYYNAWKGIFTEEIEKLYSESYVNLDFLKKYASFELQAIKMMDRMDNDRYSFNFMERQRHFRKMVRYSTACLIGLKVDLVICDYIPHRIHDYVLYLLCDFFKIKFLTFRETLIDNKLLPLNTISSIPEHYGNYSQKTTKYSSNDLEVLISKSFSIYYNNIKSNFEASEPIYMQKNKINNQKSSSFINLFVKILGDMRKYNERYFGEEKAIIKGFPTYIKNRHESIENSSQGILKYAYLKLFSNKLKRILKKEYHKLIEIPNLSSKYILFAMHYQPEMTSSPSGDIFVDQILCVETLLKNTPDDVFIYVKEHRSQFFFHGEGHRSRIIEHYYDLKKYSRVKLISENYSQNLLIKNALAVSTITGTSGWESIVIGKPVIIFGINWYERYKGVLRVKNEETANKISDFIFNFKYDESDLIDYLINMNNNTVKAYAYRGYKDLVNISENDCVKNLVDVVVSNVQ